MRSDPTYKTLSSVSSAAEADPAAINPNNKAADSDFNISIYLGWDWIMSGAESSSFAFGQQSSSVHTWYWSSPTTVSISRLQARVHLQ